MFPLITLGKNMVPTIHQGQGKEFLGVTIDLERVTPCLRVVLGTKILLERWNNF